MSGSSDLRHVVRGFRDVFARYVAVGILGVAWAILVTNSVDQREAGLLLVIATFPVLIPPLIDFGIPTYVGLAAAQRKHDPSAVSALGFAIAIRVSIAVLIAVLAIFGLAEFGVFDVDQILLIGVFAVPPALIINTTSGLLRGMARFGALSRLTAAPMILLLTGSAVVVAVGTNHTAMHLALLLVASYLIPAAWGISKYAWSPKTPWKGLVPEALAYSLPLYVGDAAAAVRTRSDVSLVALLLGAPAAAAFGVAAAVAIPVGIVSQAAFVVLFPFAARDEDPKPSADVVALASKLSFLSSGLLSLGIIALGPGTVARVFGDSYASTWKVLAVYLPGVVLLSVSRVLTSFLTGRGQTRDLMMMNLVAGGLAVVSIVGLSIALGIVGAALAVTLASGVGTAWRAHAFRKTTQTPIRELFLFRRADLRKLSPKHSG